MQELKKKKKTDLEERMDRAAEAKKALLERFKEKAVKSTVVAVDFVSRQDRKAQELEAVRRQRAEAKEAARLARIEAEEKAREAAVMSEEAQIAAERESRKQRKAQIKAEARAKREASQAVRQARRADRPSEPADPWGREPWERY